MTHQTTSHGNNTTNETPALRLSQFWLKVFLNTEPFISSLRHYSILMVTELYRDFLAINIEHFRDNKMLWKSCAFVADIMLQLCSIMWRPR